jgi:hypothetical protein
MPTAPTPVPPPTPPAATVYDDFSTYNSKLWDYADKSLGTTDGCKVWYLKNHSLIDTKLSLNEGKGLKMLMSSVPCKRNPAACRGAKMTADHLTLKQKLLYGDYELRMRAPYRVGTLGNVSNGIYAYFTAGYGNTNGVWNEVPNIFCLFLN